VSFERIVREGSIEGETRGGGDPKLTGFVDVEGVHLLGVGAGPQRVGAPPRLVPHNPALAPRHLRHAARPPQPMDCII